MSDDAGLAAHADWYRTFFRGLALDLWRAAVPPELARAEADYLVRELGLRAGARVLDVPCGDGRHALELAARGLRVTGVDLSPGQIASARERSAQLGAPIEWRLADMRDLPWSAAFDGACCMGNSFGYIEPAACEDFLRAVARALLPGARFVLDTGMVAEALLPRLVAHEEMQVGDILFVQDNRYLPAARCIETVYTMTRGAEVQRQTGLQWVWTRHELRALLERCGLRPCAEHASIAGDPWTEAAPSMLLVAQRE